MRAESEREMINRLLDEETSIAEDRTQNALLPPASAIPEPDEDVEGETEPDAVQPQQGLQNDPGSDLATLDESEAIQAAQEPVEPLASPEEPEPVLEVLDESDKIAAPSEPTETEPAPGDTVSVVELPEAQWNEPREDPEWEDVLADMMASATAEFDKMDVQMPTDQDMESELGWRSALENRSNSF